MGFVSCFALVMSPPGGVGLPYGLGLVAGGNNRRDIDPAETTICRALGYRLAEVGLHLQQK
jgi:NAD(P)H dehydrogenase (quinone)